MKKFREVAGRILATFAVSALSVVGAGALVGIEVWQSALMAGVTGVAVVVEGLARAYLKDGDLTYQEIDEVFAPVAEKKPRK